MKVALGLSGGVDSAVCAHLLLQQGHEVESVHLVCWEEEGCRAKDDRNDAMKVALQLNIPFTVLDFRQEYKDLVLQYFYDEYQAGRTPNPDVLCNREIKFGLFYTWAMKQEYDCIATGHYADILTFDKPVLASPKDQKKDQTYFLYQLRQEQLSQIIFPLGKLLKSQVREIASTLKLPVADKKDSMGICFVGNINIGKLLTNKFGLQVGQVTLTDGTLLGEHDGYFRFTIGQRGNWRKLPHIKIPQFKNDELPKLYVVDIDKENNRVVVGTRDEVMKKTFELENLHWIDPDLKLQAEQSVWVKIRNTGAFLPANLVITNNVFTIDLFEKTFGISPGQHCVIYSKKDEVYFVFGGGVIRKILK